MRIVVDLDGVICKLKKPGQSYLEVEPNLEVIEQLARWKSKGHKIIIYTSRHMRTCNGDVKKVISTIGEITKKWLEIHNVPYDEIYFGKPYGDVYIDDLAIGFSNIGRVVDQLNKKLPIFVIPMAGKGSRFISAGYSLPKYMIEVNGLTLFEWSLLSLPLDMASKILFIILAEHEQKYSVSEFIKTKIHKRGFGIKYEFCFINEITRGQAETVYFVKNKIEKTMPLVIYNIDTYFSSSRVRSNLFSFSSFCDGFLGGFKIMGNLNNNFSYIKVDNNGYVVQTAEKEIISDIASTGLYVFTRAHDFFNAFETAINSVKLYKGEYYVAPLYNILINEGKRFIVDYAETFFSLGTPEELKSFSKLKIRWSDGK